MDGGSYPKPRAMKTGMASEHVNAVGRPTAPPHFAVLERDFAGASLSCRATARRVLTSLEVVSRAVGKPLPFVKPFSPQWL
jgi:hypothetical protein